MTVLWLTVLLSALLAFVFLALFVRDQARRTSGSPERAALLPLQEPAERRVPPGTSGRRVETADPAR